MQKVITDEQESEICRLYCMRGATLRSVSEQTHWSVTEVRKVLIGHGVPVRRPGGRKRYLPVEEELLTAELYKTHSITEVAGILGLHRSTVWARLQNTGVQMRPAHRNMKSRKKPRNDSAPLEAGR